jgi:type II secretory pathway predicted ATPase ExeA
MMKRIKLIWFTVLVLFAGPSVVTAQQTASDEAAEKIKAIQIQYLTKKLDLTPEEAQKFLPVYNNYTKEVEQLIAEHRDKKDQDHLTPDEAGKKNMDKELNYQKRMLDIRSRYSTEFQKVLPGRKAGMVFKSEREFRNIMVIHLNNQRMNRMGQGGGPNKRRP